MSETPNFELSTPPQPEKKRRGPKKKPVADKPIGDEPKRGRKSDFAQILQAARALNGLSEDEAALVQAAAEKLQAMPKKARSRIVIALGQLFPA